MHLQQHVVANRVSESLFMNLNRVELELLSQIQVDVGFHSLVTHMRPTHRFPTCATRGVGGGGLLEGSAAVINVAQRRVCASSFCVWNLTAVLRKQRLGQSFLAPRVAWRGGGGAGRRLKPTQVRSGVARSSVLSSGPAWWACLRGWVAEQEGCCPRLVAPVYACQPAATPTHTLLAYFHLIFAAPPHPNLLLS